MVLTPVLFDVAADSVWNPHESHMSTSFSPPFSTSLPLSLSLFFFSLRLSSAAGGWDWRGGRWGRRESDGEAAAATAALEQINFYRHLALFVL